MYSVPRRLGFSDSDADDVFQLVFGIVLRRLETLRDVNRLAAWLIRTTHRECWRLAKRRAAMRHSGGELDQIAADEAPTEEQTLAWERQHLVRSALTEIDERCQQLLTALFFEHETPDYEALGDRLNMPVGSIGPTRARCFQKLERILKKLGF